MERREIGNQTEHTHEPGDSQLAKEVTEQLHKLGLNGPELKQPLNDFFGNLARTNGPAAIGLIYHNEGHNEGHARPGLNVYLLWSSPIDLESEGQTAEMDAVGELHSNFAMTLQSHLDTSLDFVDPGSCTSITGFKDALEQWSTEVNGRVLACSQIPKPSRQSS